MVLTRDKEFSLWSIIFVTNALCQKAYQKAFPNDTVPKMMEEMFENI
jgi:hypothetical protein